MILSVAQSDVSKVSKFGEDIFQKDILDTALINIEFKIKAVINTAGFPLKTILLLSQAIKVNLIFDDTKDGMKIMFCWHKVTKKVLRNFN